MGGQSQIPFSAIDRYARRYGITGVAFDWLVTLIDALEAEYLPWAAEQARQAAEEARLSQQQHRDPGPL